MNMATKTRGKTYECKHCGQLFDGLSALKEHGRTHTGVKPYTCKYCNKSFSWSSHCKLHERIHTGEKPYTCKHCRKRFSQSFHCRQHERTHEEFSLASIVKSVLASHQVTAEQHEWTKGLFNKLTSVFHASILLLIINFVITLSKQLWIHEAIAECIRRLL